MNSASTEPAIDTDNSFRQVSSPTGEREPAPKPLSQPDVRSVGNEAFGAGSRIRYVAERGSGVRGTAYNELDWEVLDKEAPAGRRVLCRTTQTNARLIAYALNRALPS